MGKYVMKIKKFDKPAGMKRLIEGNLKIINTFVN
jgi:hypothetical protein